MDGKTLILGIETSCDETAASVTADGRTVLSNIIASQIDVHKVFGGVVPEIAARHHLTQINGITAEALRAASVQIEDIDAVAATMGPGLVGAVLIGLATAKGIAFAADKPLIGVHHIRGHIFAAFLEHPELEPPFLALVVSGGHTSLVDVRGYGRSDVSVPAVSAGRNEPGGSAPLGGAFRSDMEVLGRTRDDAAGEAYDKTARVLGLGYPGGPKVDALAKQGNPDAVHFKRVMLEDGTLDFSFSGLKTAVINHVHSLRQAGTEPNASDIAASFQQAVIDVLAEKTMDALKRTGRASLAVCGGVASNSALRTRLADDCARAGIRLCVPSPVYCTDNAAMIACAGYYDYKNGRRDGLGLDAYATLGL